ncbi:hypothetical protein KFL_012050010, partial [Klebsormidium nitens]
GAERIAKVKAQLAEKFDVRDLGEATYFLGMELTRDREARTLKLTQKKLTGELVGRYGLADARARSVPLGTGDKLTKEGGAIVDYCNTDYAGDVDTREYTTGYVFLIYGGGSELVEQAAANGDGLDSTSGVHERSASDYAGDVDTRQYTTGYVFLMYGGGGELVEQPAANGGGLTVEAEYLSAAQPEKEALWFRKLGGDLGLDVGTIQIYCDNQGAIRLLKHSIALQRSKHVDVIHHFARERVARKEVAFAYCRTEDMKADIMTKALAPGKLKKCKSLIGVI